MARTLRPLLTLLALMLLAAPAAAQTVAFSELNLDFDGYGDYLSEQLDNATAYDVRDSSWFLDELDDAGCAPHTIERDTSCMLGVTHDNLIDAVIVGDVVGGGSPESIQLRVLDGVTGFLVGRVTIPLSGGRLSNGALGDAIDDLGEHIDNAGWGSVTSMAGPDDDYGRSPGVSRNSGSSGGGTAGTHDAIRVGMVLQMATRSFDLSSESEDVIYDAPFYPGLRLDFELFPAAFFTDNPYAGGFGLYAETGRHNLVTVTEVTVDNVTTTFEIPTRHNISAFGVVYEWAPIPEFMVAPFIGTRSLTFDLGDNSQYQSSFYRGLEFGLTVAYFVLPDALSLELGFGLRPSVDLGSTVEPYGDEADSSGLAFQIGAKYALDLGPYAGVRFGMERFSTTYRRSGETGATVSTDAFQMIQFELGYAY